MLVWTRKTPAYCCLWLEEVEKCWEYWLAFSPRVMARTWRILMNSTKASGQTRHIHNVRNMPLGRLKNFRWRWRCLLNCPSRRICMHLVYTRISLGPATWGNARNADDVETPKCLETKGALYLHWWAVPLSSLRYHWIPELVCRWFAVRRHSSTNSHVFRVS